MLGWAKISAMNLALVGSPKTGKSSMFLRIIAKTVPVGKAALLVMATSDKCKFTRVEDWTITGVPSR